jgi:hypothetical protein
VKEVKDATLKAIKALACTFHPTDYKDFYRFLEPLSADALQKLSFKESVDLPHLLSKKRWMEKIHYSWFLPYLEMLPRNISPLFLTLFEGEDARELEGLLHVAKGERLSPLPELYLSLLLKKSLSMEQILPRDLLPSAELNVVLKISKKELIWLIDLLGIYDLAFEIRQIVDKNLLNKIHAALNQEELHFLSYATKQSFKWTPPRLNIASWDGDVKRLKTLLHYRGLSRLGGAAFEEDESFKWHLIHQLDIGRGKALMKIFAGKHDPAMIGYFRGQVLDIVNRFTS